ncbi:hypothetical protein BGZ65_000719 [Modicella reniformis]|uniref:Uncharacterized protein n=1 Tax=Modicella reniformis TaxID=1440133 RepID=A0A9P6IPW4_9FUNG|nr:hypothetical protein BGZ65_000719 [Modicella reniformis]
MGFFIPTCIATDGIRFFAFGLSISYADKKSVYLLAKSNDYPSHTLVDLTWSLVSAVESAGYGSLPISLEMSRDTCNYDCAVDDTGVFSFLVKDDFMGISTGGLQYQPSGAIITPNRFGRGAWKNIVIPKDYLWNTGVQSALFNYKDSTTGGNTLMHVSKGEDMAIYAATLDLVSMTMVKGTTPWNSTLDKIRNIGPITYTNGSLYIYGTGYLSNFIGLSTLPITRPGPGAVPYVFIHDRSGVYSIPLSGDLQAVMVPTNKNVTVKELFGLPVPNWESSAQPPSSSATGFPGGANGAGNKGLIAGICGLTAGVIAAMVFVYLRRVRRLRNDGPQQQSTLQQKLMMMGHEPPKPVVSAPMKMMTGDIEVKANFPGVEIKMNLPEITNGSGIEPVSVSTRSPLPPPIPTRPPLPPPLVLRPVLVEVNPRITSSPSTSAPSSSNLVTTHSLHYLEPMSAMTSHPPRSDEITEVTPNMGMYAHGHGISNMSGQNPQTAESAFSIPMPSVSYLTKPGNPHTPHHPTQ